MAPSSFSCTTAGVGRFKGPAVATFESCVCVYPLQPRSCCRPARHNTPAGRAAPRDPGRAAHLHLKEQRRHLGQRRSWHHGGHGRRGRTHATLLQLPPCGNVVVCACCSGEASQERARVRLVKRCVAQARRRNEGRCRTHASDVCVLTLSAWRGAYSAAGRVYDLRGSAPGAGLPRQSAANWAGTSNIPKRCGTFQIYGATRVCSCFDRMDHGNSTFCMHPPRGVRFTVYTIQQNRWSPIGSQQATTRCLLDASDHAGARGGAT